LGTTIGRSQNPMPSGLMAETTIANMDFPCLFAQPGLVSSHQQGQLMITLQNCGYEDIKTPRCSNIGYIKNVKNPYFDKISEVNSNEWEVKVTKNVKLSEPEPPVTGGKGKISCSSQNRCSCLREAPV
jgi:hypothetical protein